MTDGFKRIRRYGFNGINEKYRAARRRSFRATERILNSYGWKTIDGHVEYVGRRR